MTSMTTLEIIGRFPISPRAPLQMRTLLFHAFRDPCDRQSYNACELDTTSLLTISHSILSAAAYQHISTALPPFITEYNILKYHIPSFPIITVLHYRHGLFNMERLHILVHTESVLHACYTPTVVFHTFVLYVNTVLYTYQGTS